eukprot:scaffold123752_cov21-Tisochrysis_lutea.AAC.1
MAEGRSAASKEQVGAQVNIHHKRKYMKLRRDDLQFTSPAIPREEAYARCSQEPTLFSPAGEQACGKKSAEACGSGAYFRLHLLRVLTFNGQVMFSLSAWAYISCPINKHMTLNELILTIKTCSSGKQDDPCFLRCSPSFDMPCLEIISPTNLRTNLMTC